MEQRYRQRWAREARAVLLTEPRVVAVLEHNHRVLLKILDRGLANALPVLANEHPAHVGVEEAALGGVRVLLGVHVLVVGAVVARPPAHGSFDGAAAHEHHEPADGPVSLVATVGEQAVVACALIGSQGQESGKGGGMDEGTTRAGGELSPKALPGRVGRQGPAGTADPPLESGQNWFGGTPRGRFESPDSR